MKFSDLTFRPHNVVVGHEQAWYKGHSLVRGPFIHGIEIMKPDGEVMSGLNHEMVEQYFNELETSDERRS